MGDTDKPANIFTQEYIADILRKNKATPAETEGFVVIFDKELQYMYVNETVLTFLARKPEELLGNSILEVYPDVIASDNHRNLLKALSGETIEEVLQGRTPGIFFNAVYTPITLKKSVVGVLTHMSKR